MTTTSCIHTYAHGYTNAYTHVHVLFFDYVRVWLVEIWLSDTSSFMHVYVCYFFSSHSFCVLGRSIYGTGGRRAAHHQLWSRARPHFCTDSRLWAQHLSKVRRYFTHPMAHITCTWMKVYILSLTSTHAHHMHINLFYVPNAHITHAYITIMFSILSLIPSQFRSGGVLSRRGGHRASGAVWCALPRRRHRFVRPLHRIRHGYTHAYTHASQWLNSYGDMIIIHIHMRIGHKYTY